MSSDEATSSTSSRNDENEEGSKEERVAQKEGGSSRGGPHPLNSNPRGVVVPHDPTSEAGVKRKAGGGRECSPTPAPKKSRCVDFSVESLLRRPLTESTNLQSASPSLTTCNWGANSAHLQAPPTNGDLLRPPASPLLFGQLNFMQFALQQARNWWRVTSPLSQLGNRLPSVLSPSHSPYPTSPLASKMDASSPFAPPITLPYSAVISLRSADSDASTSATISSSSSSSDASASSSSSFNSTPSMNKDARKQPQCEICGKTFGRCWLLKGHVRTHTGEKPYVCNRCGRAFADKSNLRAHVQTHSSVKPFSCARCGRRFALRSYLAKHEDSSCGAADADEDTNRTAARN